MAKSLFFLWFFSFTVDATVPCPRSLDFYVLENHEGKFIEVCQFRSDIFQFKAHFSEHIAHSCELDGVAKRSGEKFKFIEQRCKIIFRKNSKGIDVEFGKDCSHLHCQNGVSWGSGFYEGESTYIDDEIESQLNIENGASQKWRILKPIMYSYGKSLLHIDLSGWLALVNLDNTWELKQTEITPVVLNEYVGDYEIKFRSMYDGVFALLKIAELTPGILVAPRFPSEIKMSNFQKQGDEYPEFTLKFNHDVYVFKGGAVPINPDEKVKTFDAAIVALGNKKSVLGNAGGDSTYIDSLDVGISVDWLGDLDRDGILDIITHQFDYHNSYHCVHLSSGAKVSELYRDPICYGAN